VNKNIVDKNSMAGLAVNAGWVTKLHEPRTTSQKD
jgi:hypothetical protein